MLFGCSDMLVLLLSAVLQQQLNSKSDGGSEVFIS